MPTKGVRQIARELSLSPGTVSKALRGKAGKVSLETAQRVLDYCHRKGYMSRTETDQILFKMQSQISGKQIFSATCRNGVLMYDSVFGAICEQMQNHNLYPCAYLVHAKDSMLRFPFEQAGAVIVLGRVANEIVTHFMEAHIPVVFVDARIQDIPVSAVNSNNLESVSHAVEILAKLGHERIAFVCNHEDRRSMTYTFHQRQAGYMTGMAMAGLPIKEELLLLNSVEDYDESEFDWARCLDDLRKLSEKVLALNSLPTAVIAVNDMTAYILRETLTQAGLRIPEDISLIGYDGQHHLAPLNQMIYAPVSTMSVNWRAMGLEAVDLAIDLMCTPQMTPKYIEVPTTYEDMGTVARPKAGRCP